MNKKLNNCYYQCISCEKHYLCQDCFLNRKDQIQGNHDWKAKEMQKNNHQKI